jgi:arsenate reductase (thioredoxin)
MSRAQSVTVEVFVFEGCPHADETFDLVGKVVARLAPQAAVSRVEVDTPERAAVVGFLGSPSVRVNGRDIEGRTGEGGLSCRTYNGAGAPPEWLIEAGIVRALEPKGILFLCIANSARSQMAEGLGRSLAPLGVTIWSAGSEPTAVRPEAIAVLQEIGIDIVRQRSKGVAEIPAAEVDLVVTLCTEEVCPIFLGQAARLHWRLPDPAAVQGSEDERLAAFRGVRDELRRRLRSLLG